SIDPAICGGCHQGEHHPTYEEYSESLHAQVNDDIKYGVAGGVYFSNAVPWFTSNLYGFYVTTNANLTLKTNATTGIIRSDYVPGSAVDNGRDRSSSCGVCHSGAARMAMLEDWEARLTGITNALTLPVAQDAAAWGPTCAVCHDPHSAENAKQLRNPMRSTNYFTMASLSDKRTVYTTNFMGATATNTAYYNSTFASLYDPNIQVCGQCHNTRGARWDGRAYGLITNGASITVGLTTNVTGYSRPPHHSPQYNILIGIVQPDYLTTNSLGVATNYTARHSGFTGSPYNTNQCATCHVPIYTAASGENITGHKFDLDKKGCNLAGCHLSGVPDVEGTQITTTNNLSRLADLLSSWATNKAPALLGPTAYNTSKQNSWEFTTPGALAGVTNAGPSTANQLKLPEAIRMARFNAYMVLHDGSLGVHNPGYLRFLLRDAETKVLSQLTVAKFQANSPSVFTNTAVTFTNLSVGPAACTWDFGDASTSTSTAATVSHSYAAAGTYTVKLTATDTNGVTETMTRNNYIIAYEKPIPAFSANPPTGTAPLTVNFTNLSVNAFYYRWNFIYPFSSGLPFSNETNPSFTFTNAGSYPVRLTAYNEGGNVSITNTIIVNP
ncbi:MAG TPA: PKD domain-containing protein, partial [Verrucomicrobiae bacterium]